MNYDPELFPYSTFDRHAEIMKLLTILAKRKLIIPSTITKDEVKDLLMEPIRLTDGGGSLKPHQEEPALKLLKVFKHFNTAADTSSPGLGKTYLASHIAKTLDYPVFVISPKSSIPVWHKVLSQFNVKVLSISNFDILRGNSIHTNQVKWYDMRKGFTEEATYCHFIRKTVEKTYISNTEIANVYNYTWNFPDKMMVIVDESHYSKNQKTQTFGLIRGLIDASNNMGHKILFLSATPIEKPKNLSTLMFNLGLISDAKISEVKEYFKQRNINSDNMNEVHEFLYDIDLTSDQPPTGRITSMVAEVLPEGIVNTILPVEITIPDHMIEELNAISTSSNQLVNQNSSRRLVETMKIQSIIDEVDNALSDPNHQFKRVAIFVEHVDTVFAINDALTTKVYEIDGAPQILGRFIALIHGKQTTEETQENIYDYKNNHKLILISTIKKGGISLSFHDEVGGYETLVLINPPTSATQLTQTLGRHMRTGQKSSVTQKIFFIKGYDKEDDIRYSLSIKLNEASKLTSGSTIDFLQ